MGSQPSIIADAPSDIGEPRSRQNLLVGVLHRGDEHVARDLQLDPTVDKDRL
jgi:hypothetical protein